MAWTRAELQVADAALGIADPGQAAAALAGQTVTTTGQPFPWSSAKRVARQSVTGDWGRVVARARLQPALPPTGGADQAILAAINATESMDTDMIDPNDPGSWGAWQAGLAALHGIGDLSDATLAALNALSSETSPQWVPTPTASDIVSVRTQ